MSDERILFVDDDERILKGIDRQQGEDFDITTALGPHEALEVIESEGPVAVVVSDMRMPEMNGVQLLKRVAETSPDTVRMILTGFADLNTTIDAINEGHIFRFLAKPCDEESMAAALKAGLRQYSLVRAERELVEGTLHGSVKVLADVLSLVNPLAFGQSTRVRSTVDGILKRVPIAAQWQVEIAAMLSSLGCVTLPPDLLQKTFDGTLLNADEDSLFQKHPSIAGDLIRNIPRMDEVAAIIAGQSGHTDIDSSSALGRKIQILRLAFDFDYRELISESPPQALNALKSSAVPYDDDLILALQNYVADEKNFQVERVAVGRVREGMVLADDVLNSGGALLMSRGQTITSSALRLLENLAGRGALPDTIGIVLQSHACVTPG